jgi:hypothetical protein
MKIIGLLIMILGLAFTVFSSISFFTRNEIIKVGALELTRSQPEYFSWSPFVGIAAMVFGVFLILQARKRE